MTDAAFVDQAAVWTNGLLQRECRTSGDLPNAMQRLASRHEIPKSVLWALRYRRPKTIAAGVFARIRSAYEAECERQLRLLQHELEITRQIAGPDSAAVRAAEALVDEARS